MGRTVPSFRIVLEEEKKEWKPFRAALNRSEKKGFDDMWDIPRLYMTACSNAVSLVPLQPIFMSVLFHHYKQLMEMKAQVEQTSTKVEGKIEFYRLGYHV
ncbi:MAG: hypothetical protein M3239_04685 [Thermoproteota archaeon]|nr:hypothetical protein [Thermoproteota archaeon]